MKKKDVYIYPAVFDYADDGISVSFPDLPGCFTCGNDIDEAVKMAKEAMGLYLHDTENSPEGLPKPSKPLDIETAPNQAVMLVDVFMPAIRKAIEVKTVKKTLTIPKWLDDQAKARNINFSALLTKALEDEVCAN